MVTGNPYASNDSIIETENVANCVRTINLTMIGGLYHIMLSATAKAGLMLKTISRNVFHV